MCIHCRVKKAGGRYFPTFPDGVPFGPSYATGELAYEVAEESHIGFETPETEPMQFTDPRAREMFRCFGSRLKELMAESRPVDGPWHRLFGHKIRFCWLKGD